MEEMIGSYGPRPEPYEKTFASSEAPSGMMARGNYSVRSRVVDDDNNVFADWEWAFKVSGGMMTQEHSNDLLLLTGMPILHHTRIHRLPRTGRETVRSASPFRLPANRSLIHHPLS